MKIEKRPNRKWQNLIHLKCPNCSKRMEESGKYMACPSRNEEDPTKNCFFIKKERIVEILLDDKHPANIFLNGDEKLQIEEVVNNLGFSINNTTS